MEETNTNMNKNKKGLAKFLTGLAYGLGAGVVAGILLAPKSGHETRRDIQASSSECLNSLKERVSAIQEVAAEKLRDVRAKADAQFRNSAKGIQERAAALGQQLDELTAKNKKDKISESVLS